MSGGNCKSHYSQIRLRARPERITIVEYGNRMANIDCLLFSRKPAAALIEVEMNLYEIFMQPKGVGWKLQIALFSERQSERNLEGLRDGITVIGLQILIACCFHENRSGINKSGNELI